MSGAGCMQLAIRAEPRDHGGAVLGLAGGGVAPGGLWWLRADRTNLVKGSRPMRGIRTLIEKRVPAVAAIVLLCGSPAQAETAAAPRLAAITPVFSQLVMFSLPPEFRSTKPTYEKNS